MKKFLGQKIPLAFFTLFLAASPAFGVSRKLTALGIVFDQFKKPLFFIVAALFAYGIFRARKATGRPRCDFQPTQPEEILPEMFHEDNPNRPDEFADEEYENPVISVIKLLLPLLAVVLLFAAVIFHSSAVVPLLFLMLFVGNLFGNRHGRKVDRRWSEEDSGEFLGRSSSGGGGSTRGSGASRSSGGTRENAGSSSSGGGSKGGGGRGGKH